MIWSEWLGYAADAMNVSVTAAGVLLSLFFTMVIVLGAIIATRGKAMSVTPLLGLVSMVIFTYMQWLPLMVGSILALIFAVWLADGISDRMKDLGH